MIRNMNFDINNKLRIDDEEYIVRGLINFTNQSDYCGWTEYKVEKVSSGEIKWLSIDEVYKEYCLYSQVYGELTPIQINKEGYKQVDTGIATVYSSRGSVDVSKGDAVTYTEYEDVTEEKVIAVEEWDHEKEYSRGYYLDADEIEPIRQIEQNATAYESFDSPDIGKYRNVICISILVLVLGTIGIISFKSSSQDIIANYLAKSSNFTYVTSMTADLNEKSKADVYSTTLSTDAAAKLIIDAVGGKTEDVQQSEEDGSIAIMTKEEYCLVYKDEEGQTLVQISKRLYVYSSTHNPYHAHSMTSYYYRRHYYSRGYFFDSSRYKKANSSYSQYTGDALGVNSNDPYRNYSDTIRQSSVNTRRSSGGGTSSGK